MTKESMKGKRVNLHIGNFGQVIFSYGSCFPTDSVTTCIAWMFSYRMKNATLTARAVHASKIRVKGLAISNPSWKQLSQE